MDTRVTDDFDVLASSLLAPGAKLFTRDKPLRRIAKDLAIGWDESTPGSVHEPSRRLQALRIQPIYLAQRETLTRFFFLNTRSGASLMQVKRIPSEVMKARNPVFLISAGSSAISG